MRARVVMALLVAVGACSGNKPAPVAVVLEPEAKPPPEPVEKPKPKKSSAKKPASSSSSSAALCARAEQFGPIQLSPEQYAKRIGAGVSDLSALKSSKDKPVEVCHVRGEQEFLLATRCADGSAPFADKLKVAQSRTGSVGGGGRCKSIIDLYTVACPEATYEVYIDMYMCPEGSTFG